ncbi:hypothetical protein DFH09DRAFT_1069033 [Mycena vulgaris]|nr:hypothetical protein DFH09DRAFT_1069033 [Mycena vulgaris]
MREPGIQGFDAVVKSPLQLQSLAGRPLGSLANVAPLKYPHPGFISICVQGAGAQISDLAVDVTNFPSNREQKKIDRQLPDGKFWPIVSRTASNIHRRERKELAELSRERPVSIAVYGWLPREGVWNVAKTGYELPRVRRLREIEDFRTAHRCDSRLDPWGGEERLFCNRRGFTTIEELQKSVSSRLMVQGNWSAHCFDARLDPWGGEERTLLQP